MIKAAYPLFFTLLICNTHIQAAGFKCEDNLLQEKLSGSIRLELIKENLPDSNIGIFKITNSSSDNITISALKREKPVAYEGNIYEYHLDLGRWRLNLNNHYDGWRSLDEIVTMGSWGGQKFIDIVIEKSQQKEFIGPMVTSAIGNDNFAYKFHLITKDAYIIFSDPYCFFNE